MKINANELWGVAWTYIKTVVDTMREPFLILDKKLQIISANTTFYSIFQASPEETEGELIYNLGNGQWNIPKLKVLLEDILPKNTYFGDFKVEHDFPKIGHKIMLLNARRIYVEGIEEEMVLLALEDITRQKQLEDQLIEAKERDFISLTSHQLLTPLSLISGYVSMLISGKLGYIDQDAKNYLEETFKGTARMANLVKELLATSRIESGNIKIQKSNVNLNLLIKEVAEDLKSKWQEKGLTLNLSQEKKLMVLADKEHTRQVLTNILDNAIKYTKKGNITITVSSKDHMGQIIVSDTGIGINKDTLPHIFEKFFMSANWVSKQSESHGLGLYISKLLLDKMDGKISVNSEVNKGSTFTIGLPVAKNG